jgi:hypothetical protein
MDLFSESKNAGRWLRVVFQRGFVANTHLGVQATSLQYSIRLERVYLGFIPQSSLPLLLCLSTLVSSESACTGLATVAGRRQSYELL